MTDVLDVVVPDIGDFTDVPVIEILVAPGATVAQEDSLVTLESDKATMDVPSPAAGVVQELKVKLGDRLSEGNVILTLDAAGDSKASGVKAADAPAAGPTPKTSPSTPASHPAPPAP